MIPKRVIPLFLLRENRLVKGTRFSDHIDVGDPLSQAMIYDAQGADEIIILDIEGSRLGRSIRPGIIQRMIERCRLPITAGGGIKTVADARALLEAGADKILVNTQAILHPAFIKELSNEFGSQSIVVGLDVRKNDRGEYDLDGFSGWTRMDSKFQTVVHDIIESGAGEMMITSINREGTLSGFDIDLYRMVRSWIPVPLIGSGGAGSYDDIVELFNETDCDACAIGKMLFLRDYDIVRIKSYIKGGKVLVRDA